jgi:hypothetical protein
LTLEDGLRRRWDEGEAVRGVYGHLGREAPAVYADGGGLAFRGEGFQVALDESTRARWQQVPLVAARLTLLRDRTSLWSVTYRVPVGDAFAHGISFNTGGREEWDFGVYVLKVVNDPKAREFHARDPDWGWPSLREGRPTTEK